MNFDIPENTDNNAEQISAEKQAILDEVQKEVEGITDLLDHEVDEGIKDTVVYAKALGLETDGSCEGHVNWNHLPYISFASPGHPRYTYEGERDIYEETANRNGITVHDMRCEDEHEHLLKEISEKFFQRNDLVETDEYVQWAAENKILFEQVGELLEEFYQGREVDSEMRLILHGSPSSSFRITNDAGVHEDRGGDGFLYQSPDKKIEGDEEELSRKVSQWQEEMAVFTEFLKRKFLQK